MDKSTLTSTEVVLKWDVPMDPNGVITMYNISVEVVSTDPGAYFMGMGMGSGDKRRRRRKQTGTQDTVLNTNCIVGDVGPARSFNTSGRVTSLVVNSLCKYFGQFSLSLVTLELCSTSTLHCLSVQSSSKDKCRFWRIFSCTNVQHYT